MYKLLFRPLCEGGINLCDHYCNIRTSSIQQLLIFKENILPSTVILWVFDAKKGQIWDLKLLFYCVRIVLKKKLTVFFRMNIYWDKRFCVVVFRK